MLIHHLQRPLGRSLGRRSLSILLQQQQQTSISNRSIHNRIITPSSTTLSPIFQRIQQADNVQIGRSLSTVTSESPLQLFLC